VSRRSGLTKPLDDEDGFWNEASAESNRAALAHRSLCSWFGSSVAVSRSDIR